MRHIVIAALSFGAFSNSYAECPDLAGTYVCDGDSIFFQPNTEFTISQKSEDNKTVFTFGTDPNLLTVSDGKVTFETWSVPQCAGGLIAQQTACENGTMIFRSGVEVFFAHEIGFSKRSDGDLLFKGYELDPNNEETAKERVDALIQEWQTLTDSLREQEKEVTQEEVLEIARTFATDKSLVLWEQMKKDGLLALKEVVCQKK